MDKKMTIGLRIKREEQQQQVLKMIVEGSAVLAQVTYGGVEMKHGVQLLVKGLKLRKKHLVLRVQSLGNQRAGINAGQYEIVFDSDLNCIAIPGEMHWDGKNS